MHKPSKRHSLKHWPRCVNLFGNVDATNANDGESQTDDNPGNDAGQPKGVCEMTGMEFMVPTNTPAATVARVIQRIDRAKLARDRQAAIKTRDKKLQGLDDDIKAAEQDLFACEYLRLKRRVDDLRRERLDAEGVGNGAVHGLEKQLRRDANNDRKLANRLDEVARMIHRETDAIRGNSPGGVKQAAAGAERLRQLTEARQQLEQVLLAVDPLQAANDIVTRFELES